MSDGARKKIYFASDAHLGARFLKDPLATERRLTRWLDSVKREAAAIWFLGDMFDYWYEYKYVVPKGHTRFLGKLAELTKLTRRTLASILAGIHPMRMAERISDKRLIALFAAVRQILSQAIAAGGSTLRDFHGVDGADGYFALRTNVYGREGEPCRKCGSIIKRIVQAGRSTFYCPKCQK